MDAKGSNGIHDHVSLLYVRGSCPDPACLTRNGPNEFHITGSLKTWSVIDDLYKINVPTLLLNGRYDEAQDTTVEPFFQHIPKVKWVQFAHSAHVPQLEETERFMEVVGNFLLKY